jgi:CheY-like chemotaxis protein
MSHELRTPLNGVLGYAQLLQRDRQLGASQREALEAIARCGSQLLDLINDILDLSRIEAGRLDIEEAPTDLASLVTDLRYVLGDAAERKGLRLSLSIGDGVPHSALLDGRRLRQVLLNLLGNAVKFTASGDVALRVSRTGTEQIAFEVADTGPGIEAESLQAIFEAFSQTKTGAAAGGSGLGLAISNRLVRKMGGELQVESALGQGSRFWFTLPLVDVRDAPPAAGRVADPAPPLDARLAPGERLTALVVDDSTTNRRLLERLLESAGVHVLTAAGGLEGVELARAHRPQIVFMDLRMLDLDGLEATRRLARDPVTAAIPVIAVTASTFGDVRQAARDAGCVDYLSKPVRAELLFAMLQTHVGVRFVSGGAAAPATGGTIDRSRCVDIAASLRAAISIGDVREVQDLARRLASCSPAEAHLGERIARLAAEFQFDRLGELADSLETSAP